MKNRGLALLLLGALGASAQVPSDYQGKFSDDNLVRLKNQTEVIMTVENDQLSIVERTRLETYVVNHSLNGTGQVSLNYELPFTEIGEVEAYTLVPKEGKDKYRKEKVKLRDIEDKKTVDNSVFHDGTRAKIFTFPSVKKGAITVMEYEEKIYEPRLLGRAIFSPSLTTLQQQYTLRYQPGIELDIQYYNCDSSQFNLYRGQEDGYQVLRWEQRNIAEMDDESSSPSFLSVAPHIVYRIKSFPTEQGPRPVLRNVSDLYAWYNHLLNESANELSDELQGLTDSLTAQAEDDYTKAKAIYDWVNHSIRYIAVEDGLGGFIPRSSNQVCSKRYGDCKDMSNIMVDMMKHAGLQAQHVWIGTRSIPYRHEEVPSSLSHNHMIASVELNNKRYFLDATNKNLPFPYPSEFTQGKEGLIGFSPKKFELMEVPVMPASFNWDTDTLLMQLKGTDLQGIGRNYLYGYPGQEMAYRFENYEARRREKLVTEYYELGNNRCKSELEQFSALDTAVRIQYQFTIPRYSYANGEERYLNLNLEKRFTSLKLKKDRRLPLQFDRTTRFSRRYIMELPEGTAVGHLPKGENHSYPKYGLKTQYQKDGNRLIYDFELVINTLLIKPDEFEQWNTFMEQLNRIYQQSIVIKQL